METFERYVNIPVFDGEKESEEEYKMWSRKMKTLFQILDLWDVVHHGYKKGSKTEFDQKNDRKALFFIQQGVSSYIFPFIAEAKTSKEAWEAIKYVFDDNYGYGYNDGDGNDNNDDNEENIIDNVKDNLKEDHVPPKPEPKPCPPRDNNLKKDHVPPKPEPKPCPPPDNYLKKDHVPPKSCPPPDNNLKKDHVPPKPEPKPCPPPDNYLKKDHVPPKSCPPPDNNLKKDHVRPEPPAPWDNYLKKDDLAIRMEGMLEKLNSMSKREKIRCIFKVPDQLRKGNEEFFDPKVVPIGPNHPDKSQFASMEIFKMSCLKSLLERLAKESNKSMVQDARPEVPQVSVGSLVQALKPMVERVRKCYGWSTESTLQNDKLDKFVQMLVLDGCLIIELLSEFENKPKFSSMMTSLKKNDNYVFRFVGRQKVMCLNKWRNSVGDQSTWIDSLDILYIKGMLNDLWLIDNQIPFFIIKTLYSVINSSKDSLDKLQDLTSKFLHLKYGTSPPLINMDEFKDDNCHLLYIAHKTLCSEREKIVKKLKFDGETSCLINSARKLEEANVKLMANTNSKSIFNIIFNEGKLIIPCFNIDDQFEIEIRNFIALEMCQLEGNRYYCDYVVFMDHLIASSDDVDLLIRRGIITNYMIDANYVNEMFMKLTKKVVRSYPYTYSYISNELNEYYKLYGNTLCTTFKHKYLKSPLTFIAIVAASMLFLFTFTQTVFTIIK